MASKLKHSSPVIIAVLLVVIVIALIIAVQEFVGTATPPRPTPTLEPEPFADGTFGILIADFCDGIPEPTCNVSARGAELSELVETDLGRRLSLSPSLAEKVEIRRVGAIANPEDAAITGLQLRATLVIWGWILAEQDDAIATRFIPVNPVIDVDTDNVGGLVDTLWIDANITGSDAVQVGTQVALRASVAAEFITGFMLMLDGKWPEAIVEFNNAVEAVSQSLNALPKDDPRRVDVERGLAALYVFRGTALAVVSSSHYYLRGYEEEDARADFERAIELNRNLAVAYVNLGNLDFANRSWDSAQTYYLEALRINRNVASTHIGLGNIIYMTGYYMLEGEGDSRMKATVEAKWKEALRYYNEAVGLAGDRGREAMQDDIMTFDRYGKNRTTGTGVGLTPHHQGQKEHISGEQGCF
jgi:tetratricopeptide (TPR) repeat protein